MEEIILQKSDMPDKPFTLAGRKGFLYRFADTGFATKWCGIWFPPFKFFEYFAYNINGEWLSPQNIEKMALEDGSASHIFGLKEKGLRAEETVFVPKKLPAVISVLSIKNTSSGKKEITVALEAALNIRTKAENIHSRTYETSFSEIRNAVVVKSEKNYAAFGLGKTRGTDVSFEKSESYKEHSPGGELQRCFLPGKFSVKFSLDAGKSIDLPFIFSGSSKSTTDLFSDYDICFKDWKAVCIGKPGDARCAQKIITPDKEINRAYLWSHETINSLIHESSFGTGMFAGYPWFLEFWGRDTFWSLRGLIDAGEFGEAKNILRTMAAFQKKRMPCLINLDGSTSYHGADVDALFLIALDYYLALSGDSEFEKELAGNIKTSLDSLVLLDYMVQHTPEETWMDSISRNATAVEIQSFWIEALRRREPEIAKKMHEKLSGAFWNADEKYFYDTAGKIPSAKKTSNALFPLVFGQAARSDASSVLDTVRTELASPYGIRTLSALDKNYSPSAYHNGAAWGFTTAIGACAALNYGKVNDGMDYIRVLAADAKKHLEGMSECLNAENGELNGCTRQLWSSALFVHAIDSYLFGISYNASLNRLVVAPLVPAEWKFMDRKNKRAGENIFDLAVVRTKKGYELDINFRSAPQKMKAIIFVPEGVKSALINGKKTRPSGEKSIEFFAEKANSIAIEVLKY